MTSVPGPDSAVPFSLAPYAVAADLFRAATTGLGAVDLDLPVGACPGWSVSDVVTHVLDDHLRVLATTGVDDETADVLRVWERHLLDHPQTPVWTTELTLHGLDVARAVGRTPQLPPELVDHLEAFAAEQGEALDAPGGYVARTPGSDDRLEVVLARYGRPAA
ncbi:maleylpyruvate isomerase N-terminal domain-containing protein [Nocardioides sp. GY 10127]|uniref:maleylpyruvate isomerase N-terminal domain-containing protein n=1 Tax=Nocardioides sp. GY 10127 TaxID=2569762 RepID=UPI0010A7F276|nr:maleylpyruvate isomerase N-terminal domain-containing protein [Nocardioides sp. GY 10127]TIC85441.1 hypothetical protein E8D37_02025 [Nocardioides sp. GY 10127]